MTQGLWGGFRLVSDRSSETIRPCSDDAIRSSPPASRRRPNASRFVRWRRAIRGARAPRAVAPVEPAGTRTVPRSERPLGGPKQRLVLALAPRRTEHDGVGRPSDRRRLGRVAARDAPGTPSSRTCPSCARPSARCIERDGTGYAIRVDRDEPRHARLRGARRAKARARLDRDPAGAVAELEAALALWRGRPFEDIPDQPSLQAEATRLEELRLAAIEAVLGARLALGEHGAGRRRPRAPHPRAPVPRGAAGAADARPLPLRAAGRRPARVPGHPACAGRGARHRSVASTPPARGADPAPGSRPRSRAASRRRAVAATGARREPVHGPARVPRGGCRTLLRPGSARRISSPRGWSARRPSPRSSARADPESRAPCRPGCSRGFARDVARARASRCCSRARSPSPSSRRRWRAWRGIDRATSLAELRGDRHGTPRRGGPAARHRRRAACCSSSTSSRSCSPSRSPTRPSAFLAALVRAAEDPRRRVHVLVTMRADFYDRPLADPRLGPLFAENVVNVIPMGPTSSRRPRRCRPASSTSRSKPRLVGRLIADVAGQPNALPLFQYALTELFDERDRPDPRPRDLRADRRRAQGGGPPRRVALHAPRRTRAGGRRASSSCASPPCRATPSAAAGSRRRSSPRSTSTSWRCRRRSTRSPAIACSPSIATRRPAPRPSRSPTRPCSPSGTGCATGSTRAATTSPPTRASSSRVNEWEAAGRDARLPPRRIAARRLRALGATTESLKLTDDRADVHRRVGRRTRGGGRRGPASARRSDGGCDAAPAGSSWRCSPPSRVLAGIIAYPIVTGRRAARADRGRAGRAPRPRAASTSSSLAASSRRPRSTASRRSSSSRRTRTSTRPTPTSPPTPTSSSAPCLMWDAMVAASGDHPDTTFVFLDYADAPRSPTGSAVHLRPRGGLVPRRARRPPSSRQTGRIGYIGANRSPAHRAVPSRLRAGRQGRATRTSRSSRRSSTRSTTGGGYDDAGAGGRDRRVDVHARRMSTSSSPRPAGRARVDRGGDRPERRARPSPVGDRRRHATSCSSCRPNSATTSSPRW